MNFNDFFGGLQNAADWIENVLINGLLGQGFQGILKAVSAYLSFKPIIDFFTALFGLFAAG